MRLLAPLAVLLLLTAEVYVFRTTVDLTLITKYPNHLFSVVGRFFVSSLYEKGFWGFAIIVLAKLGDYKILLFGQKRNQSWYFAAHAASVAVFYLSLRKFTIDGMDMLNGEPAWLTGIFCASFFSMAASLMPMLAPIQFWKKFLYEQKWAILSLFSCFALYGFFKWKFKQFDAILTATLFAPTVSISAMLDHWLGYKVLVEASSCTLTIDGFSVIIAYACLGYEGFGLILLFLGAYIYFSRNHLKFPNVLWVMPVAAVAIWLLNAVRIALLMAIGASWSPDIAIQGFHSAAGWWDLIIVFLLSIVAINRFKWFTRRSATRIFHLTDENVLLVPQLALIAVSLGTLLFTASFDWLYPVRVFVVGAVLYRFRNSFRLGNCRLNPFAIGVGIVVFLMWIVVVPESAEKSQKFSSILFSVPLISAVFWVVMRTMGAVIIVPFAEELAFRGFLLPYLEKFLLLFSPRSRQVGATLISSVAFGALHGSWIAGTLAGIGFAIARFNRGQLFDAISAHMTANLLLAAYVMAGANWSYW